MARRNRNGLYLKDVDKMLHCNVPPTDNMLLIEYLDPLVSNERLAVAFALFGSVKFAYILVDANNDSAGIGIVSFLKKENSIIAAKRCKDLNFVIASTPTPVKVTLLKIDSDEYIGLPEILINDNTADYKKLMTKTARFIGEKSEELEYSKSWSKLIKEEEEAIKLLKQEFKEKRFALKTQILENLHRDERNNLRESLRRMERKNASNIERIPLSHSESDVIRERSPLLPPSDLPPTARTSVALDNEESTQESVPNTQGELVADNQPLLDAEKESSTEYF